MYCMRSITVLSRLATALVFVVLAVPRADAAELLMFEEDWCHWCEKWNDEVGVVYAKTAEGKRAPLRRIDIHGEFPDVRLKSRPQFTPTFVLIDQGRELGRIEGYPGEDFFWGLLGRLLEKLPPPAKPSADGAVHTD